MAYRLCEPTGRVRKDGTPCVKKRNARADEIPPEILGPYCKRDVDLTWQLYQYAEPRLREQGLWELFELECGLIPVLASMECHGTMIDVTYLETYKKELEAELQRVEIDVDDMISGYNIPAETIVRMEEEGEINLDGNWWWIKQRNKLRKERMEQINQGKNR